MTPNQAGKRPAADNGDDVSFQNLFASPNKRPALADDTPTTSASSSLGLNDAFCAALNTVVGLYKSNLPHNAEFGARLAESVGVSLELNNADYDRVTAHLRSLLGYLNQHVEVHGGKEFVQRVLFQGLRADESNERRVPVPPVHLEATRTPDKQPLSKGPLLEAERDLYYHTVHFVVHLYFHDRSSTERLHGLVEVIIQLVFELGCHGDSYFKALVGSFKDISFDAIYKGSPKSWVKEVVSNGLRNDKPVDVLHAETKALSTKRLQEEQAQRSTETSS